MRLYRGFRGGDRPKLAEEEFPEVCVTPRGNYEPWMLFRKPIAERTVAANLRRWGTGALRRVSVDCPFPDIIQSGKTPAIEENIGEHPTLKPQHLLRILARTLLPLGKGVILEPFAGSGSAIAACEAIGYDSVGVELDECHFHKLDRNIAQLSRLYPGFKGESMTMPLSEIALRPRVKRSFSGQSALL